MKLWKRLLHWIARRELAEERDAMQRYARLLYSEASKGTVTSLRDGIERACLDCLPACVAWDIEQRENGDLSPGKVRIIVEQPPLVPRRAS